MVEIRWRNAECQRGRLALTLKIAYGRWGVTAYGDEFSRVARQTLGQVQAASASC